MTILYTNSNVAVIDVQASNGYGDIKATTKEYDQLYAELVNAFGQPTMFNSTTLPAFIELPFDFNAIVPLSRKALIAASGAVCFYRTDPADSGTYTINSLNGNITVKGSVKPVLACEVKTSSSNVVAVIVNMWMTDNAVHMLGYHTVVGYYYVVLDASGYTARLSRCTAVPTCGMTSYNTSGTAVTRLSVSGTANKLNMFRLTTKQMKSQGYVNIAPITLNGKFKHLTVIDDIIMPTGTNVVMEYSTNGADFSDTMPYEQGEYSGEKLYIRYKLTGNGTAVPFVIEPRIFAVYETTDTAVGIKFDKPFRNAHGDISLHYDQGHGSLYGEGGSLPSFTETFTPARMHKRFIEHHILEHEIANIKFSAADTPVITRRPYGGVTEQMVIDTNLSFTITVTRAGNEVDV